MAEPIRYAVQGFLSLLLSERQAIVKHLGLSLDRTNESDFEWSKRVIQAAREQGEMSRLIEAVDAALARRTETE